MVKSNNKSTFRFFNKIVYLTFKFTEFTKSKHNKNKTIKENKPFFGKPTANEAFAADFS